MYHDDNEEDQRGVIRAAHLGRARAYGKAPLKAGDMPPDHEYFHPEDLQYANYFAEVADNMYCMYQPRDPRGGSYDPWTMLIASVETDVRYAEDGTAEVFLKDNPSCVIETIISSERRIAQILAAIEPAERREKYTKQIEAYRRDDPDAIEFWHIEILKNERLKPVDPKIEEWVNKWSAADSAN